MKDKKYTIEEISEAWLEFNKPMYFVSDRAEIDIKAIERGQVVSGNAIEKLPIDYGQWIPFLISWKKHK